MSNRLQVGSLLVLAATLVSAQAWAGSAVVGSVARSLNASVGGQAALPHQAIFSGDSLQVKDGALLMATDSGSRMVLGRDTTATFQRDARAVTVVLSAGNVSLYHANERVGLRVQAGAVIVDAVPRYKTLGDVAMMNEAVVVTAKEGALRVNDGDRTVEVTKGKTITVKRKVARTARAPGSPRLGAGGTALRAGVLGGGATAAIFAAEPIEDDDCDKDDRPASPHKPPKCPH